MLSSPQLKDFQLLLEVFCEGLKLGLISREEIVSWADHIITNADEPEYFFIEVSLSHDVNGLIETLNRYVKPTDDPICARVILGLVHNRRPIYDIEKVERVAIMIGNISSRGRLTSFEDNTIYVFEDYYLDYDADLTQLQVELINFLDIYKAFTLENYKQWVDINLQVLELLKEKEIEVRLVNQSLRVAQAKTEKKRKLKFYFKKIGAIVLLLFFFSLMIALLDDGKTKHFTLYLMLFYCCIRLLFGWWNRKKELS